MNSSMLAELIEQGENVSLEFKSNDVRPESLAREAGLVHFDVAPVERTDRTSLDDSKLHQYFDTYYQRDYLNLEAVEQQQLLINTDMLIEKEGGYQASVGGLLLFGKQPQRYLPQSSIMFAVFRGSELTDDPVDKKNFSERCRK